MKEIIPKIVEKSLPAVVSIIITEHLEKIPPEIIPFLPRDSKGHLKIPKNLKKESKIENGSGFIVDSSGIILTNKHIVSFDKRTEYSVITYDNKKYPAKILSRDPINDVAILKIETKNLKTLPLGDSSKLKLGQTVIAIGNALGIFQNTVSAGIISGLSRLIYTPKTKNHPAEEMRGLIQTDAAINPGNSGGPLIDLSGKVVGINSAIVAGAENIGFAIPINAAKRDLLDIKKYGRIKRPFLGIRYINIDQNIKEKLKIPFNYGALIIRESINDPAVIPNSPAWKAGLKEKDIILECDSQKIITDYSIFDVLEEKNVGDKIKLLIWRGGKFLNFNIVLSERK